MSCSFTRLYPDSLHESLTLSYKPECNYNQISDCLHSFAKHKFREKHEIRSVLAMSYPNIFTKTVIYNSTDNISNIYHKSYDVCQSLESFIDGLFRSSDDGLSGNYSEFCFYQFNRVGHPRSDCRYLQSWRRPVMDETLA